VRNLSPLNSRIAPLLAMAGASLPWIVYDMAIGNPADFWTIRGLYFVLSVVVGVYAFVLAWYWCRGPSDQNGTYEDDFLDNSM